MKFMRHYIIALIVLVFCFGCTSGSKSYTVTRETGFYSSLDSDDFDDTVSKGTRVKPAEGAENIICKYSEAEAGIKLCYVEIISTGEIGWILKNALDF